MPTVQYIGDPTWGPQQQVARRQQQLQTSVTLGLADADPTVKDRDRDIAANPYQLRNRYSSNVAVSNAVQIWIRKRLNTTDLGLTDADPNVKVRYQDPYQRRRIIDPAHVAAHSMRAWQLDRLNTNDLGTGDADPTIRPLWQYDQPYTLWKRDSTASAISAVHQWLENRLSGIDLGLADQDTSLRPNWQAANPYQLRWRDSTYAAIEAMRAQIRLWQGIPDEEPPTPPVVTPGTGGWPALGKPLIIPERPARRERYGDQVHWSFTLTTSTASKLTVRHENLYHLGIRVVGRFNGEHHTGRHAALEYRTDDTETIDAAELRAVELRKQIEEAFLLALMARG